MNSENIDENINNKNEDYLDSDFTDLTEATLDVEELQDSDLAYSSRNRRGIDDNMNNISSDKSSNNKKKHASIADFVDENNDDSDEWRKYSSIDDNAKEYINKNFIKYAGSDKNKEYIYVSGKPREKSNIENIDDIKNLKKKVDNIDASNKSFIKQSLSDLRRAALKLTAPTIYDKYNIPSPIIGTNKYSPPGSRGPTVNVLPPIRTGPAPTDFVSLLPQNYYDYPLTVMPPVRGLVESNPVMSMINGGIGFVIAPSRIVYNNRSQKGIYNNIRNNKKSLRKNLTNWKMNTFNNTSTPHIQQYHSNQFVDKYIMNAKTNNLMNIKKKKRGRPKKY